MRVKLYSWTALHKMHNKFANENDIYGIYKNNYQKLTKHSHAVIFYDKDDYRLKNGFYIPRSCVKEIIYEDARNSRNN